MLWHHWHVRKIHRKWCWHFCTFLQNPHFDFEPDYVIRKPRKGRFQWYIVRPEIFSTFHTWVEYISVKTVIGQPTPRAAMTPQSIYRLVTERWTESSITISCRSLRSLGGYNKCLKYKFGKKATLPPHSHLVGKSQCHPFVSASSQEVM